MFTVNELLKVTSGRLIVTGRDLVTEGISLDSRTIKPHQAFIAIKGNNFDGHDFIDEAIRKGASCIIGERGWESSQVKKVSLIEVDNSIKALGDMARFQREKFDIPLIAITGTNGKTTTKEMVSWILTQRFKVLKNEGTENNQIGLPLTLLRLNSSFNIVVLELGTNHFGEIDYLSRICQPNIAIITNIGYSHLEYLSNLEGVFKEKFTLVKNLKKPYIAILNVDDNLLKKQVSRDNKRPVILGFGIKNQSDFFASHIKIHGENLEFLINKKYRFTPLESPVPLQKDFLTGFRLKTLGRYNVYNALAAIAISRILGMEYPDITERLNSFKFPAGRLDLRRFKKIRFIDDTYNSNPVSLDYALEALSNFSTKGRKIFVMGDMLELGRYRRSFHHKIGRRVTEICDAFITVGALSKFAAGVARHNNFDKKNIFSCESSCQARDILFNKISPQKDDIVLVKGSRLMKMEEIFRP